MVVMVGGRHRSLGNRLGNRNARPGMEDGRSVVRRVDERGGATAPPRQPGLLDLPALMLPALLLVGGIVYTAWSAWWI